MSVTVTKKTHFQDSQDRMNLILLLLTDYLCNTKKCGSYSFGQMWNNLKMDVWCDQTAKVYDKGFSPKVLDVSLLVMDNPYCLITHITNAVSL